jgi:hypothetical protein
MSDVEYLTTAKDLRIAIRAKIRDGASARSIWLLISSYVPTGLIDRLEDGKPRLPVELVPYGQRTAFLEALANLAPVPTPKPPRADL